MKILLAKVIFILSALIQAPPTTPFYFDETPQLYYEINAFFIFISIFNYFITFNSSDNLDDDDINEITDNDQIWPYFVDDDIHLIHNNGKVEEEIQPGEILPEGNLGESDEVDENDQTLFQEESPVSPPAPVYVHEDIRVENPRFNSLCNTRTAILHCYEANGGVSENGQILIQENTSDLKVVSTFSPVSYGGALLENVPFYYPGNSRTEILEVEQMTEDEFTQLVDDENAQISVMQFIDDAVDAYLDPENISYPGPCLQGFLLKEKNEELDAQFNI
ncbi:hypothetical protein ACTXT7_004881 [Hymenolepis weldensis]